MKESKSLSLRLLGALELARGGKSVRLPQSKKTRALLAYLAISGRPHRRERLCSLLWDVTDDPRAALRWSLSKLRALVDEPKRLRIVTEGETVAFEANGAEVDVLRVRGALAGGVPALSTEALEALAGEFRGDLLEGFDLPDFFQFQAWLTAEREETRRLHRKLRAALVERLTDQPEQALEHGQVLVDLEPYDEAGHAAVTRLFVALGRHREADQQVERGLRALKELELSPSGELESARSAGREPAESRPATVAPPARPPSQRSPADLPEPETHYARSGDVSIAYQVVGEGPIDIVLVPGWVSHVEYAWEEPSYSRFLRRLASFSRLILLDRRGTGLSDRVAALPTLEERMQDTRAVMDAAGCERAALFGISEGGPICLVFAATYPERASALVLCNTSSRLMHAPDYPCGWKEEEFEVFLRYLQVWGTGRSVNLLAPSCAGDAEFRRSWARFERFAVSPAGFQTLMRMNADIDARHALSTITAPTLIVHRKDDAVLPVAGARYMAERISGARYVELPGVDHFLWTGDVDAVLGEVEEFLTGVRRGPEPHRQLMTLLFTDVANSTARAALVGDRYWADMMARHDAIVRRELARHQGAEVDHLGDGFLASFDGPARAIRCAGDIVTAGRQLGLDIRVGVHTGECERHEGRIRGLAVHIGARVAEEAEPGEVLVSQTVRDLVAGSGIHLESRGVRELKGVPGEWGLFSVRV
jgi:DNA-binding SARP family transcriptional activator/pimeloyl-ACP methyl ester carboxylesterase